MIKRIWDDEPARVAGVFIASLAVVYSLLRWAGVDVPDEVRDSIQIAIGLWVAVLVRSKSAPIDGPQNASVKQFVQGTGDGSITPMAAHSFLKGTGTGIVSATVYDSSRKGTGQ